MLPVTATDVGEHLGRTLTTAENVQVNKWLTWIEALIVARLGPVSALDQGLLGMVACEVAAARLRNPDGATSREVAVDDGREVVRYRDSDATSLSALLDGYWDLLAPATDASAFTIAPTYQPDCRAW